MLTLHGERYGAAAVAEGAKAIAATPGVGRAGRISRRGVDLVPMLKRTLRPGASAWRLR